MTTKFQQEWIVGATSTYLDDVLWPAVVERSYADANSSDAEHEAAWDAYCAYEMDEALGRLVAFIEAAGAASIEGREIYEIVQCHDALSGLVEAVNDAMTEAAEEAAD